MFEEKPLKEWSSNEKLPRGFTEWLDDTIREYEITQKKAFKQIASELGVKPSNLSRWIAGVGPLTQIDIQMLATNLNPVVYTFLGLPRPTEDEMSTE